MIDRHNTVGSVLWVVGVVIVAFSAVTTILVLFNVIPSACSFISGLQLIFLGFLFVIGALTSLLGLALQRKERKESKKLT